VTLKDQNVHGRLRKDIRRLPVHQPIRKQVIMSQHAFRESVQHRRPNEISSVAVSQRIYTDSVADEIIAKRAYDKFVARGRIEGFDREDWAGAQEELIAEASGE
jgi:hypothetical protein